MEATSEEKMPRTPITVVKGGTTKELKQRKQAIGSRGEPFALMAIRHVLVEIHLKSHIIDPFFTRA